uniref:Integrin_alpha2 domain-containing protein n=2 Tax=Steinernema glaseri TaxID=37863 RepID=A0A1I7ZSV5_9BILA
MSASSQNPEVQETLSDNHFVLTVPVEVNAQVVLVGRSNPEQLDYTGETAAFGLKLTGTHVDPATSSVDVVMSASSQNPEVQETLSDNHFVLTVPVEVNAQVVLVGRSNPEQLDYSIRNRTSGISATFDFEVGPLVTHLYQVINRGPSAVSSATLDIFWPSFAENGKHLLYLIDFPLVSSYGSSAKCRIKQSQNVNPESLTISNEHLPEDNVQRRFKRSAEHELKLREVKQDLRDAVRLAKEAGPGTAVAYRGGLSRISVRRFRRSAEHELKLREVKQDLRDAVRLAKEAGPGTAVAYRGGLSRISVNCNDLNCTHIECDLGPLKKDEFVLVEIFARLWLNTLIDDNIFEADISSLALAKVSTLPNAPHSAPLLLAVTTDVNPTDPELYRREVPWWLYVLAALIGLVILALLVLCLWRCGFFKRNRPHSEKATLDRSFGEREYYADATTRYARPLMYSQAEHGEPL